jgi:hypothetical protein
MSVFTLEVGEGEDKVELKARLTLGTIKKVQEALKLKKSSEVFARVQEVDIDVISNLLLYSVKTYHPEVTLAQIQDGCSFAAFKQLAESMSDMGKEEEA